MDLISKLFILPILLVALGSAYVFTTFVETAPANYRNSSIDGLRGFLAMFVFLHHSAIWFYFSHLHEWGQVPSDIYNHFGSTSVAFFFMITAFLFFSKLVNSFSEKLDWTKLYVSRVMRIMPLYGAAVLILCVMVSTLSHFNLNESYQNLFRHALQWVFFMEPDINNVHGTRFINSGVQWSLAYEWTFYCSLSVIGWAFFRIKTSPIVIISTLIFLAVFLSIIHQYYPFREWKRMFAFVPGIMAVFLSRNKKAKEFCSNKSRTLLLIVLPGIILLYYPTIFSPIPYLCASIIFTSIACGNNFFGILIFKPSLLLGQISYSIYLLHGFLLFITFHFLIGFHQAEKLSVLAYWEIISLLAAAVVIVCYLTYYFLEKPSMDNSSRISLKVQRLFKKRQTNNQKPIVAHKNSQNAAT